MTADKDLDEINLERVRYLLSIDSLIEKTLEDNYISTIQTTKISRDIRQDNDIRIGNTEAEALA